MEFTTLDNHNTIISQPRHLLFLLDVASPHSHTLLSTSNDLVLDDTTVAILAPWPSAPITRGSTPIAER